MQGPAGPEYTIVAGMVKHTRYLGRLINRVPPGAPHGAPPEWIASVDNKARAYTHVRYTVSRLS